MTRITNSDQVMLLLRAQLDRLKRTNTPQRTPKAHSAKKPQKSPLERIQEIAGEKELSQEALHRALIAGLLTEEFGPQISNDPGFQAIIDKVTGALRGDENARALLDGAVNEIKSGT